MSVPVPSQPVETATNAPGGIPALLGSVTNAVALLLHSTNLWTGTVRDVEFTNCAFHLEDLDRFPARPAGPRRHRAERQKHFQRPRHQSHRRTFPALEHQRHHQNRSRRFLSPPTADIQLALDRLDLGTLDPYLEPKLNLFIPGSQFGLHGQIQLRTPDGNCRRSASTATPGSTDFAPWMASMGEDLLKWDSVRVSGIEANLNPLSGGHQGNRPGQRDGTPRHRNQPHHQSARRLASGRTPMPRRIPTRRQPPTRPSRDRCPKSGRARDQRGAGPAVCRRFPSAASSFPTPPPASPTVRSRPM